MKRFKLALGLFIILVICAVGFTACNTTEIDKQRENGKIITVTYDSNGGKMLQRDGVSLRDMIDPDDYTADSEGNISIKLLDPTDARRTHGNMLEKVSVTKSGYFLAGWYQTRTVKVNADDEPIDDNGRVLKENLDGTFNYKDPKNKDEASINVTPAYNYDDLWDFNEDVITYKKGSGKKDITLYAGWVMNFKFEFYTVTEAGTTLAATYSFNYLEVEAAPEKGIDKIAIPSYTDNNGGRTPAMNYSLKNNSTTNFPSIQGKTFEAAYSDEACTEMITGDTVTHGGSMDYEKGAGVNPIKKIYAKYSEGEVYKIKTAKELASNAKAYGWYEIDADELDFTEVVDGKATQIAWPTAFSSGSFTGRIYPKNGSSTVTIKNVVAVQNRQGTVGGLFGEIKETAKITNVTFENISYDMAAGTAKLGYGNFGAFAGNIEEDAELTNVTLTGVILRIGLINYNAAKYNVNLIANGDISKLNITGGVSSAKLKVYGKHIGSGEAYYFTVKIAESGEEPDPAKYVKRAEDGKVEFNTQFQKESGNKEVYEIK